MECKTHIIKQNIENASTLYNKELAYKVAVYLNESGNSGKAKMSIETNLGVNMKDESEIEGQATYIYNSSMANQSLISDYITISGLGEQDVFDRLFDVEVKVYASDVDISDITTSTEFVSLTGGLTSE